VASFGTSVSVRRRAPGEPAATSSRAAYDCTTGHREPLIEPRVIEAPFSQARVVPLELALERSISLMVNRLANVQLE
jgi:hypothetical protein